MSIFRFFQVKLFTISHGSHYIDGKKPRYYYSKILVICSCKFEDQNDDTVTFKKKKKKTMYYNLELADIQNCRKKISFIVQNYIIIYCQFIEDAIFPMKIKFFICYIFLIATKEFFVQL